MRGTLLSALTVATVVLSGCWGCGGIAGGGGKSSQTGIDEAYQVIDSLYDNEASDEEKLAATVDFLEAHPESEHTVGLVKDVLYFRGEKSGDMNGAVEFAEQIRSRLKDPGIATELDRQLISWYGKAGMKAPMLSIAERFEQQGIIRFGDYFNVIENAVAMEDWALAREYCGKARGKASAAAWRAEWPDIQATDERAEKAGLNRLGMLLVKEAWAQANQGDVDGALDGFARAEELVTSSYIGIPGYDLDLYWGRTLMMKHDGVSAMAKLAPASLIAHDDDARVGLVQAYAMAKGSDSGFAAWCRLTRLAIAKTADDFELPDSGGIRHRFADLRGNVTLLNFWSPT